MSCRVRYTHIAACISTEQQHQRQIIIKSGAPRAKADVVGHRRVAFATYGARVPQILQIQLRTSWPWNNQGYEIWRYAGRVCSYRQTCPCLVYPLSATRPDCKSELCQQTSAWHTVYGVAIGLVNSEEQTISRMFLLGTRMLWTQSFKPEPLLS